MPRPTPGERFGPYQIEGLIGQGGMGVVYRARQVALEREVALKVLIPSAAAGDDSEATARFLREARLGAALEHPGIAVVYDVGTVEGTPYLAMEWIDGRPLRAIVKDAAVSLVERVELLSKIAEIVA